MAQLTASVATPGTDPDADIITASERLLAGNPFPQRDPQVASDIRLYERFKSPITTRPQSRVPIFWVGGLTDALFPAFEPLTLLRRIQAAHPRYPFKLFLGDLGHDYAAERQDEWDLVKPQMNAFVDHYLRPDRTPDAPQFDTGATFTRCLDHDAPARWVHASRWHDLHPERITFVSNVRGETSTDASHRYLDVATERMVKELTHAGSDRLQGLPHDAPVATGPDRRDVRVPGRDGARPDGRTSRRRDVHGDRPRRSALHPVVGRRRRPERAGARDARHVPGARRRRRPRTVRFQLAPKATTLAGNILKAEVTANDTPYMQKSNILPRASRCIGSRSRCPSTATGRSEAAYASSSRRCDAAGCSPERVATHYHGFLREKLRRGRRGRDGRGVCSSPTSCRHGAVGDGRAAGGDVERERALAVGN